MELTIRSFLIVCPLVFLAGFVDAVGGGGGLISLPAYLLAGIPVHSALATNKLSSCIGTAISTVRYCWKRKMDWGLAAGAILLALAGSSAGAQLSILVEEKILKMLLLIVLPVVAFYVFRTKSLEGSDKPDLSRARTIAIAWMAAFLIGCYDGFYGPGTGTFLLLVFTGAARMDMMTAAANTKLVNFSSNLAAMVVFLIRGKTYIGLGLVSAAFCVAGHYLGAGMVLKSGTKIVKPIIILVLSLLFIKVIVDV